MIDMIHVSVMLCDSWHNSKCPVSSGGRGGGQTLAFKRIRSHHALSRAVFTSLHLTTNRFLVIRFLERTRSKRCKL